MIGVTEIGARVFAIDARQNVVRGVLVARVSHVAVIETDLGRCRRRRRFHARFVARDWSPA